MYKIGQGFDVHAFDTNSIGPLTIGGVKVEYKYDFLAHSDGDVLIHAICDAILGALCLGDIGKHFPDTSAEYHKIDSKILLARVNKLMQEAGYKIVNIDSTVIAQRPKLSRYIEQMRQVMADVLGIDPTNISVKATTSEKLGFTGREEGIAAQAVCLLQQTRIAC